MREMLLIYQNLNTDVRLFSEFVLERLRLNRKKNIVVFTLDSGDALKKKLSTGTGKLVVIICAPEAAYDVALLVKQASVTNYILVFSTVEIETKFCFDKVIVADELMKDGMKLLKNIQDARK